MGSQETKYPKIDEPIREEKKEGVEHGDDGRLILTKRLTIAGMRPWGKTSFSERLAGRPFPSDPIPTLTFGHKH